MQVHRMITILNLKIRNVVCDIYNFNAITQVYHISALLSSVYYNLKSALWQRKSDSIWDGITGGATEIDNQTQLCCMPA